MCTNYLIYDSSLLALHDDDILYIITLDYILRISKLVYSVAVSPQACVFVTDVIDRSFFQFQVTYVKHTQTYKFSIILHKVVLFICVVVFILPTPPPITTMIHMFRHNIPYGGWYDIMVGWLIVDCLSLPNSTVGGRLLRILIIWNMDVAPFEAVYFYCWLVILILHLAFTPKPFYCTPCNLPPPLSPVFDDILL